MNGITKLKCIIAFSAFKNEKETKSQLKINEHYFSLGLSALSENKRDLLRNIFAPLYISPNSSLHINYSFIKNIQITSDPNMILIEVFNPVMKVDFCFTITKLESIGIVFTKKLAIQGIKRLVTSIKQRIIKETKDLIQKFLLLLSILKDCLDPQKTDNQQFESILLQAYITGKNYYEKYTNEYKNNLKIKNSIKKQLNDKLKVVESMISKEEQMKQNLAFACFDSLINEFKIGTSYSVEESILLFFQILSVEMNAIDLKIIDDIEVSSNLKTIHENYHIHFLNHHLNHSINNINNNVNNSNSISQSLNNSKKMSLPGLANSKHINKSISSINKLNKSCNGLFEYKNIQALAHLTVSEQNCNNANGNNKDIESMNMMINQVFNDKHHTTISLSTENTSKKKKRDNQKKKYAYAVNSNKELLETPKFYSNNNMQYNKFKKPPTDNINNLSCIIDNSKLKEVNSISINQSEESLSMIDIMKQIDHLSKVHSFVPPINMFNIFINTSEIIHRTFFELCFEVFLGKIFSYETDKDNLIKIDSLYNYFLYLRGMKNFIFSEKNKMYFSSMLFLAEDLK